MNFQHYLHSLFNPESIAVIGASERAESSGRVWWSHIRSGSYKGSLYPVNPKYKTLSKTKCYPSLSSVKKPVELVVVATPPATYEKVLSDCMTLGVKAVLLCGGFPKTSLTEAVYKKIDECAAQGIQIMGPQSLGFSRPSVGLNASCLPVLPKKGDIGLISQSPGLVSSIIEEVSLDGKSGFSTVIDPGLESTLATADYVDMLATDPETRCIVLYLETFKKPRKLLSAIRLAAKEKPVILLKGGRTPASADIIINNNGSRQDEEGVMEKALRRSGALIIHSIHDVSYAIQAFSFRRQPPFDNGLFGIVNSKGLDTLMADELYSHGIALAVADSQTASTLSEQFGIIYPYANPLNIGLATAPKQAAALAEFLLNQPICSGLLLSFTSNPLFPPLQMAKALVPVVKNTTKPVITAWGRTPDADQAIQLMLKNGIPALRGLSSACFTTGLMTKFFRYRRSLENLLTDPPPLEDCAFDGVRKIIHKAVRENRNLLYEDETKRMLASLGFETTAAMYAGSLGEAREAAKALNYPLAMKIRCDGILAKSNLNGVILGIRNNDELKTAWNNLQARAERSLIEAKDFGVVLQHTLSTDNRRELRLGIRKTAQFGPIIFLEIGGFYGRTQTASNFNFVPLTRYDALKMLDHPDVRELLKEHNGLPAVDREYLCDALLKLSQLAASVPAITSLTIDPLLCGEKQAVVLDAHAVIGSLPLEPTVMADHLIFPSYPNIATKTIEGKFGNAALKIAKHSDAPAFEKYLDKLSENSKRLRFHGTSSTAQTIVLQTLTADPDRTFTVFATKTASDGTEEIMAEATFSTLPGATAAEFGISVADAYQRMGMASLLMDTLEDEARKRNLTQLIGYVLKDNESMGAMMTHRNYQSQADEFDPHVLLYLKTLQ